MLQFAEFFAGHIVLAADDDVLILLETGPCRDQMTADDILLEAFEVVYAAAHRGFAEDLGGLLE